MGDLSIPIIPATTLFVACPVQHTLVQDKTLALWDLYLFISGALTKYVTIDLSTEMFAGYCRVTVPRRALAA